MKVQLKCRSKGVSAISKHSCMMEEFLSYTKAKSLDLSVCTSVHVVMGNESCDLDSVVSAVTYALYLHKSNKDTDRVILPVLNIPECHLRLRTETTHFFNKLGLSTSDLVFQDGLDLAGLFADHRLTLTLVDHNVLTGADMSLEACVTSVVDHHVRERPQSDQVSVKLDVVGSCCTLVAEELLDDPDFTLDDQVAELLYGTVLVDTINRLPEAGKITPRDNVVLDRLQAVLPNVKGDNLFQELQTAKFNISGLLNSEILERDLKVVSGTNMTVAIPSVTMDMKELLARPHFRADLQQFSFARHVDVVVIMTLCDGDDNKPRRQIAVFSENIIFKTQIMDTLTSCIELELDQWDNAPFDDVSIFTQGNVKASRKKVMPILKSFVTV